MPLRQFHHLMHLQRTDSSEIHPVSYWPHLQLPILDTLSKYSHDSDFVIALNAIFAMGLVGAVMVRLAQGLVHMGKGTNGLNPFFSDRSIMSRPAIAGLCRS
ncbi:hypothetical protein B0H13DRAFT_2348752 [Mycena leptocephala]|nr:hypothetical protein B0H13DRAFT_2348752 [Mycena leptocephala]